MDLEQIKNALGGKLGEAAAEPSVAARLEREIASLNRRIVRRKLYGTSMLALSAAFFVLLAWLAYRMNVSAVAIAGLLICVGTFLAAIVALHRMQHVRSPLGLTVSAAQRERLRQVRREIVFYRSYSPWVLAGIVIGGALLGVSAFAHSGPLDWSARAASLVVPLAVAAVSIGMALKSNRDHVRLRLAPLEARLRENVEAMSADDGRNGAPRS